MRTKAQILSDSLEVKTKTPDWDVTASTHERLTLEVLVDIRDIINTKTEQIAHDITTILDSL